MRRLFVLLPLFFVLSLAPALAAPQSVDAFLHAIYAQYVGDGQKTGTGVKLDSAADMHRYFTDDLVALVEADEKAAEKRGDVPTLDGDPFIDAQDWQIAAFKVHVDSETASAARATVTFKNIDEAKTIHLDLVMTSKGWRISDIMWPEGSFRGLYKKKS